MTKLLIPPETHPEALVILNMLVNMYRNPGEELIEVIKRIEDMCKSIKCDEIKTPHGTIRTIKH
ncbi:hypothetical protein LCGC14_2844300 [marine sediment metagenome]|uniref:Uncharacterized protein n=1 Tax=marine sediment metagenome TaxID=412755 RepID=A0A0F8YX12_9ZZZZ